MTLEDLVELRRLLGEALAVSGPQKAAPPESDESYEASAALLKQRHPENAATTPAQVVAVPDAALRTHTEEEHDRTA